MSHLPSQSQVTSWGVQDVINFLSEKQLSEFAKFFRENHIDGYHFANLTKAEIHNMPKIANTKKRDLWKVVNSIQGKKSAPSHTHTQQPELTRRTQTTVPAASNHHHNEVDDFSDDEWGSDFDDDEDDFEDDGEALADYENEDFKTNKKQPRKYDYEDATIKPNQPGFYLSFDHSDQNVPSEIYENHETSVKSPEEEYMDMNKPSQPWLVNKLTAALQNRSSSYKNTKGSNNEMTHSEEDYIPVLKDEDCPPPIPSRRNQPGKPNTNMPTRSSPIPAHRAPAKPSYQQDPQELYVEPNDNTSTASGPPVPPSRPPQTLPPFDPDEDYIEPDVEMHQPIKRTLPAIPNQQSKISPIINQREQCRIPTVPKREKSPIPKAESIPPSKPTSNKPVKRGVIPPPPTAKAVNGAKFGIDKPASPLNLRKHMQPSPQSIESYPWYHKNTSRQQAEPKFKNFNTDGAYIVRDSTQQNQPYTLMAFKASETKVYNLPVRRRPDNMYALGGEKRDEVTFKTVPDMIEHFLQNTLIVGSATEVRLSVPLPK